MNGLSRDLWHALRTMRHGGGTTAITVLTLSLGIGVMAALFAVVDAVLLRPLVPDQDRVVYVTKADVQRDNFPTPLSLHEYAAWREAARSFESLAAVDHAATGPTSIGLGGTTAIARLAPVSADFFDIAYRGAPLNGRWFTDADERPGTDVAAVVSERFWQRAAGGDPRFIGRRLEWAGNRSLLVVGIAPAAMDYPLGTDIWAPASRVFDGQSGRFDAQNRTFAQFELLGRLAPGVGIDRARAELTLVHRRLAEASPGDYPLAQVSIEPVIDAVTGSSRRILLALAAGAGLVFLVGGVNVAALLLMRAVERQHEIAVRLALGAREIDVLRHTVAEALVLSASGIAGGILIARGLLVLLPWLSPGETPRLATATIDLRVVAFCAVTAIAWVVTLGTVPVWWHRRRAAAPGVGQGRRGTRRATGLTVFAVAQVTTAVVVTTSAALLIETVAHLRAVDRGFDANHLTLLSFVMPASRYRDPQAMIALYDRVLPQIETLPGVRSASPVHVGPGSGTLGLSAPMLFEGQTPASARANPWSTWEPILPSYFRTLGIPIVRGRAFTDDDRRESVPVAIVSESTARRYWPGQNPVGKRLRFVADDTWPWVTVVGVARDTRYRELTRSWLTVYFPARQFFFFQAGSLVVRSAADSQALAPVILRRMQAVEPALSLSSATSIDALLGRELARPLTAMSVASMFAALAIVLATIGVFGVLSDNVRQRRRELAVRAAIGATPSSLVRQVLARGAVVSVTGAAAGLLLAASMTRALEQLLFEVRPLDPIAFAGAAGLLVTIVLAASFFPARHAARTDPAVTLRIE